MHRGLLMAHQYVLNIVVFKQCIIDWQHRTPGIAEHHLDAFILKRLQQHVSTGHYQVVSAVFICCVVSRRY